MGYLKKGVTGVAVAALLAAAPAAAVVRVAKYSGTLVSGYDITGVFGVPGFLDGARYVMTFTYDRTRGGEQVRDANIEYSLGGLSLGTASPVLTTSLTINGVTRRLTGAWQSTVVAHVSEAAQHLIAEQSDNGVVRDDSFWSALVHGPGLPFSLDALVAPTLATFIDGEFHIQTYDSNTNINIDTAFGELGGPAVYSVSDVPEPASWMMLIAGFGLVGAVRRRRRRVLAA